MKSIVRSIVCIDDDRETATLIAEHLTDRGHEVRVAHDGRALAKREVETLTWAARGKTSAEIAQILGLSKRTVDFHIENARSKLGVSTRTQAVAAAAVGRLIRP